MSEDGKTETSCSAAVSWAAHQQQTSTPWLTLFEQPVTWHTQPCQFSMTATIACATQFRSDTHFFRSTPLSTEGGGTASGASCNPRKAVLPSETVLRSKWRNQTGQTHFHRITVSRVRAGSGSGLRKTAVTLWSEKFPFGRHPVDVAGAL